MPGNVGMDVDISKGVKGRDELKAKWLNRTDYELTDY